MMKEIGTICTERLIFKGIEETDAAEIVKWRSNPEVYKFFKAPHKITIDEHLNWYRNSYLYNTNRFDWICFEKKNCSKIGVFGLVRKNEIAEVNYLLAPEAQHKGYAAEGILSLVNYASETWNVKQVAAEIHKNNIPSINVVKKLGFNLQKGEGDFVIYRIEV